MSRNWALIVGVNQYNHHPDQNLRFAVRDAELMRDFLVNGAGFPENQVICCLGQEQSRNQNTSGLTQLKRVL
ncbi:MAG: hypothetical protein Fur0046_06800 [Cyanobacteria bacterium J069]|nr:MAG: hypothetical protein D6742_09940 [Cyanobacteria bacterium J069]